jgi:hypothetical protein
MFTVFGANFFLKFADIPPPPADSVAMTYLGGIMVPSGYLAAVKVLEITGGILLLSGRLAPLGITLLTPIALNILFYELFLLHAPGPGYLLFPLCAFLVYGYRAYFASVFTTNAKVG